MPSPFQQQSRLRKLVYTGLIIALFCVTLFFRRANSGEFVGLEARANNLGLREQSLGDVELTGSAIRLTLTGSRGLAVCALWWTAEEKKKKHQWNELELLVRSVTKLQPHFITPWLFQSWNLAYNVSVESDRVKDKYFYVTRGIELLAEGERLNRGDPDMRFYLGFYNQQKIGAADEANTFRSFYQMSCIPPSERDPNYLRAPGEGGRTTIDQAHFEEFCQKHPMLIRRLRNPPVTIVGERSFRCETPEEVVDFLATNQNIPTRYEETNLVPGSRVGSEPLKPAELQFPVLPPRYSFSPDEPTPESPLGDDSDNYTVARAWFGYAQETLPPPEAKPTIGLTSYDRSQYRAPRAMASHIFRGYPARAQSFVAEHLEKEGWFDREGWLITGWFPDDKFQAGGRGGETVVGDGRDWAVRAWSKAHDMYRDHGIKNGLYLTPEQLKNLDDQAALYRKTMNVSPGAMPGGVPAELRTAEMLASYDADQQLYWYQRNREMTNFPHFFYKTEVEMELNAVRARKGFYEAEQLRRAGKREQALQKYAEAFPIWRELLLSHPEFRHDSIVQEDTAEEELRYLALLRDLRGRRIKELMIVEDYLAQAALRPPAGLLWLPPWMMIRNMPPPLTSPLDAPDDKGQPLIPADAKSRVRSRLGLPDLPVPPARQPAASPAPAAAVTGPGGG